MKRIEVYHQGRCHHLDHREPLRLSARLDFADNPTNLYGVAPADSAPLSYGDTVASVRHGGVCNAERISLVPHCHGTHTECIGHILPETHNVADLPLEPFIAATLIRVRPQRADATAESYNASAACEDWLITRAALDDALAPLSGDYLQALVIATEAPSDFRAAACAPTSAIKPWRASSNSVSSICWWIFHQSTGYTTADAWTTIAVFGGLRPPTGRKKGANTPP